MDDTTSSSDLRRHAQRCADELLPDQLRALADRLAREALRELVAAVPAPRAGASRSARA